jgi:hypothetical protein
MSHDAAEAEIEEAVFQKLLKGLAATGTEAESQILDERLDEIVQLVRSPLSDADFRNHPLIRMLFSHGSRGWEDSLL